MLLKINNYSPLLENQVNKRTSYNHNNQIHQVIYGRKLIQLTKNKECKLFSCLGLLDRRLKWAKVILKYLYLAYEPQEEAFQVHHKL